jgi:hypothetical protein
MKFEANSGSQAPDGPDYCRNCERHKEYHEPSTHACAVNNDEAVAFAHTNERLRQAEAAGAQGIDFTELHSEVAAQLAPTTAPAMLQKAACLLAERGKQYDQPTGERSAARIVTAFNAITRRDLSEAEGWLFLQILKQVRLFNAPGYHADSAEDNIAYGALLAEAKQGEARP